MDILSLIISLFLAALLLYLLVRLPLAIARNLRAGHRFRQGLARSLQELRLARMLKYLGIDHAAYLHRESTLEIKQHMRRCEACDAKSTCDEVLQQDPPATTERLGFCANIEDLKDIRRSN